MRPILDEQISNNPDNYRPCYHCGNTNYTKSKWTWWGGVIGPKLLNHVKCNSCGKTYNGKTGNSNTQGIVLYTVIGIVLSVAIVLLFIL